MRHELADQQQKYQLSDPSPTSCIRLRTLFGVGLLIGALVAEIPDLDCLVDTPQRLRGMITKASGFRRLVVTQKRGALNQPVPVTGIGMFETLDHATCTSPNGIELHPVIAIEFLR